MMAIIGDCLVLRGSLSLNNGCWKQTTRNGCCCVIIIYYIYIPLLFTSSGSAYQVEEPSVTSQ